MERHYFYDEVSWVFDFYYNKSPTEVQERQFRSHIEASRVLGLPLVIHTRNADDAMARILKEA